MFRKKEIELEKIRLFTPKTKRLVIVMNTNQIGLGIIRNFKDADVKVLGVTKRKNFVSTSKYLSRILEVSIEEEPRRLLDRLLEIGAELTEKGFIIPTSEIELRFLFEYEDELSPFYHLSIPRKKGYALTADKYNLYKTLIRYALHVPKTLLLESEASIRSIQENLRFPCILKPVFSGDWKTEESFDVVGEKKAFFIQNPSELAEIYERVSGLNPKMILQEIVESEDGETYSFCSFADNSGKVLWGFVTKKILQYPEEFGTAILCRTIRDDDIYALGVQVVEKLKIDGICEVEIMREAKTGVLSVIEVNTRHWQQHILSGPLGKNITLLDYYSRTGAYQNFLSELEGNPPGTESVLWIDDVGYLLHCLKNRFSFHACKFSSFQKTAFILSTLSIRDFIPFASHLADKVFQNLKSLLPMNPLR